MNNIKQLLVQAQTAYDAGDFSQVMQLLQQLILTEDLKNPEIVKNRASVLELALAVLEIGDFQQRWDIAKIFSQLGNIAIPPLIEILKDEEAEEELRWYAARTLGELKHPDAIPSLVELLKIDENKELQAMAATALGQMGENAIAALTELLAQEDTKLLAVLTLSSIRQKETIAPILTVVEDTSNAVRAAAIEALSSFHDPRVPPVLIKALADIAATIRRQAVQGLGFRPDLSSELDLVTKLQPRLYDFNLEVCCAAAVALSRMNCDEAAKYLFQVLISPHTPEKLQLSTIRALSWMGSLSSLKYLQEAFFQLSSATLWQEIVTVIGRVQSTTDSQAACTTLATEILLSILRSPHPAAEIPRIKSAIALSLGQLGQIAAMQPLTLLLADEDPLVKLHAVAALKNIVPQ